MFHKITSLATLPDYILLVGFADGEFKQFDLKPLIDYFERRGRLIRTSEN